MSERKWKEQTVDTDSEVWNREKTLEGKLVKIESDIGPNKSHMYTVETDDGEIKVWGSTVLDDKLMSVPKGTYVKIEYEGKLKSKKGAEYHSYKVFIDEDSIPQAEPTEDTVHPVDDGEIDLKDIPF